MPVTTEDPEPLLASAPVATVIAVPRVGAEPTDVTFGILFAVYERVAAFPAVIFNFSPMISNAVGVFVVHAVISSAGIAVPRVGAEPADVTFGTVVVTSFDVFAVYVGHRLGRGNARILQSLEHVDDVRRMHAA